MKTVQEVDATDTVLSQRKQRKRLMKQNTGDEEMKEDEKMKEVTFRDPLESVRKISPRSSQQTEA